MKILISIAFAVLFLALFGCSTGSTIVTGDVRPSISPAGVKLYLKPPSEYKIIGLVEASSDIEFTTQGAENRVVEKLKEEAGKIGANGIILTKTDEKDDPDGFGYEPGDAGGIYLNDDEVEKVAKGKAIFVTKE